MKKNEQTTDDTGRVTAEDWAALDAVRGRLDEWERLRERLEKKYGIPRATTQER